MGTHFLKCVFLPLGPRRGTPVPSLSLDPPSLEVYPQQPSGTLRVVASAPPLAPTNLLPIWNPPTPQIKEIDIKKTGRVNLLKWNGVQ